MSADHIRVSSTHVFYQVVESYLYPWGAAQAVMNVGEVGVLWDGIISVPSVEHWVCLELGGVMSLSGLEVDHTPGFSIRFPHIILWL